jgi:hypothetical protein
LAPRQRHRAKLIIAKLDRLSRNMAFIANLMDSFRALLYDKAFRRRAGAIHLSNDRRGHGGSLQPAKSDTKGSFF